MEKSTDYAAIIALIKRFSSEGGGNASGGVSESDFNSHVIDNKRHLTTEEKQLLEKIRDYDLETLKKDIEELKKNNELIIL